MIPSRLAAIIATSLLWTPNAVSAQVLSAPAAEDITVTGKTTEPDLTNREPMVFTGSRLARRSLQNNPSIASATGFGGLQADSGLDAFKGSKTKRWKTCKATGANLSKATACALIPIQKAFNAGDYGTARDLAARLAAAPDLGIDDRYVVQTYLFRVAEQQNDNSAKRSALLGMIESGAMPTAEEASALRSLASLARRSGDDREAVARYRQAAELDPADAQSRTNAIVLLQRAGQDAEAKQQAREAVAIAERAGNPVPALWRDLAR